MGPINVALVNLFRADQRLREAKARLDAVTKDVRVQTRRVNDLAEKLKTAQNNLKTLQSKAHNVDLDLKSRDARIELLRSQQQNAKNNREYQALLVEINTLKVDRSKAEDEALKSLQGVENEQKTVAEMTAGLENERKKLAEMEAKIGDSTAALREEIAQLEPEVQAARAATPQKGRDAFDRIVDKLDGEALAPIQKPDRRREEYMCGGCNMDLVVDLYNRLHNRDELIFCPSCRRILYIPEDLPPETAVHKKKVTKPRKGKGADDDLGAAPRRGESALDVLRSVDADEDETPAPEQPAAQSPAPESTPAAAPAEPAPQQQ